MTALVDVLIATYQRAAALAVTLASLCELPTTVADRRIDAPHVLGLEGARRDAS